MTRCSDCLRHVHGARCSGLIAAIAALIIGAMAALRPPIGQSRAVLLADELVSASADGVPLVLEQLRPVQHQARQRLQDLVDQTPRHSIERLRAAYGLMAIEPGTWPVLLESVATAPNAECRNLVTALALARSSVQPELARLSREADSPAQRARHAIVALQLGDTQPAQMLLQLAADRSDRTAFIEIYAVWHGDLGFAAELLQTCQDDDFRSGLCTALGTIDDAPRQRLVEVVTTLYRHAPDGGTHSAAGWTLNKWSRTLPDVSATAPVTSGRRWYVNGQGMTLVALPAGRFRMGTTGEPPFDDEAPAHEVSLTHAFYLADREVTVEQFLRFVHDAQLPTVDRPVEWDGPLPEFSPSPDCPVQMVSWYDAILYCNWLSRREGRRPCYVRNGTELVQDYTGHEEPRDVWRWDRLADGYRLPTESEWEYAVRAECFGSFSFGEGATRLQEYAWFANNSDGRTWPGGRKLPNAWGLFDMHGNVAEWCWDFERPYTPEPVSDPAGPAAGEVRTFRGGAMGTGALACRSAFRAAHRPTYRAGNLGFRVCCQ